MNILQDKLLDLAINIVSIILGGGLVMLFIEWRRHQRELKSWKREDQILEIDIPRAQIRSRKWKVSDEMPADAQLRIYQNNLDGSFNQVVIVADFVIRNTTNAEVVVVDYAVEILHLPAGDSDYPDEIRYYDLETGDLSSVEELGATKLKPQSVLARQVVIEAGFNENRRLSELPATLAVRTTMSSGSIIRKTTTLSAVPVITDIELYSGSWYPRRYVEKIRPILIEGVDESEIPF